LFADMDRYIQQEQQALRDEIALLRDIADGKGVPARKAEADYRSPAPPSATEEAGRLFESAGSRGAASEGAAPLRSLTQAQIHEIFEFYSNFGRSAVQTYQDSLDSFMFMKFARECPGLLDRVVDTTEVDLIFVKSKPKFERRLNFEHFLDALAGMAERKYSDVSPRDGLRLLISNHLAPHYDLVQAEMQKTGETEIPLTGVFKKLYDPRSYTGVYAERFRSGDGRINGETENRPGRSFKGSTNTASDDKIHDVSVLMRSNLHGAGTMLSPANHLLSKRTGTSKPRPASPTLARMASPTYAAGSSASSVRSGRSFASPRMEGMTSPSQNRRPATADAAAEVADQAAALTKALAKAQEGDTSELMSLSLALAEQVKKLQAGKAAGSPAHASPARGASKDTTTRREIADLEDDIEQLQESIASGADVETLREVQEAIQARKQRIHSLSTDKAAHAYGYASPGGRNSAKSPKMFKFTGSEAGEGARDATSVVSSAPALTQEQLREVFDFYCNFGRSAVMTYQDSMDSFMFMKFARECPDLLDAKTSQTGALYTFLSYIHTYICM
jgi:hypothetical protein